EPALDANTSRIDLVRSPLRSWLAVVAVMTGIFMIVTAEILPIGLLIPIASTFAVSDGTAGLMMMVPGFVAAAAAPALTVCTARIDRRVMLCAWIAALAASNFLCAFANHYWMVLVSRVVVGLVIGGFWSIGAALGGRLVPDRHGARATSIIFVAVPLGSVLGVPVGTFLADAMGWRSAFVMLGAGTLAVLVALAVLMPALPAVHVTRLAVLRDLLRITDVRIGLLATFLVVLAHFGTYTYVTPLLEQVTQIGLGLIGALLLVYGAAGIVGNFVAGFTVNRWLRLSFGVAASSIGGATLLLPIVGQWVWATTALLVVWGVAYGAVPACSQAWISRPAPNATEAATVLFTSVFQATIGIGALTGGIVVDRTSAGTVMVCGSVVAILGACLIFGLGRPPSHSLNPATAKQSPQVSMSARTGSRR
ncbi:MAG TPA: MFS transporter, partial [Mycobacterium sp.]|nr:MFS transporter [Mycobacterium sp.]